MSVFGNKNDVNVGFFSIGLNTYWGQFEGLLSRLETYGNSISGKLGGEGCRVVDAGMIDTVEKGTVINFV
jgi:L-arabinose isomerase